MTRSGTGWKTRLTTARRAPAWRRGGRGGARGRGPRPDPLRGQIRATVGQDDIAVHALQPGGAPQAGLGGDPPVRVARLPVRPAGGFDDGRGPLGAPRGWAGPGPRPGPRTRARPRRRRHSLLPGARGIRLRVDRRGRPGRGPRTRDRALHRPPDPFGLVVVAGTGHVREDHDLAIQLVNDRREAQILVRLELELAGQLRP